MGYDQEWRANPELSGGGELIDQGVHLIDLARMVSWETSPRIEGHASTLFWNMPVDDNAFHEPAHGGGPHGLVARELHRVEESFLVRDLRSRRQDCHRRPGRQLRGRTGDAVSHASRMGPPETTSWNIRAATSRGGWKWRPSHRKFARAVNLRQALRMAFAFSTSSLPFTREVATSSPKKTSYDYHALATQS